jgi:hypothetical protein
MVGVVKDVPLQTRGTPPEPYVYTPFWQNPELVDARLCVRVKGDPAAMLPALAREVNRVDPDVPIAETITLPLQMAGTITSLQITASFVSYAAVLAILMSACRSLQRLGIRRASSHERDWYSYGRRRQIGGGASHGDPGGNDRHLR